MSTRFKPFRLPDPTGGWQPDTPPEKLDLSMWPVVQNARFYNQRIEKIPGWVIGASGANPSVTGQPGLICRARFADGSDIPIIATDQNVYKLSSIGALTALNAAPYAANPGVRWEADSFPQSAFFNRCDGFGQIKKWQQGGAGSLKDLNDPSWGTMFLNSGYTAPPTGKTLQQYANHLFIGALTDDGAGNIGLQTTASSGIGDAAAPIAENDWQFSSPASDADLIGFFAGNDSIQRILRQGDYLPVYKENSIQMLAFTGGTFTYLNQQPVAWMGTPSPHSVIGIRDIHYFVGQDNIYMFNGSELKAIGNSVYQTFLALLMPTDPTQLWAWDDTLRKEINWVGQNNMALVYNYENGTFSFKLFPFTAAGYVNLALQSPDWAGLDTTLPSPHDWSTWLDSWYSANTLGNLSILGGGSDGKLYTLAPGNVYDANGTPIDMLLESPDMDFGDADVKMVNELRIEGNPGGTAGSAVDTPLQVQIGVRDNLSVAVNWSTPYTVANNRVTFAHSGRWMRVRFLKHGGFCTIDRYIIFYRNRGRY